MTHNYSLNNVEKFIQVAHLYGDLIVGGDVLVSFGKRIYKILGFSDNPENGLSDYILEQVNKFDKRELLAPKVGLDVLFTLLIHPRPMIPVQSVSKYRPFEDINTLIAFFDVADAMASEIGLYNAFGVSRGAATESVQIALRSTEAYKRLEKENIPREAIFEVTDGYFLARGRGFHEEWLYLLHHPEMRSVSVDLYLATVCKTAFINADISAVDNLMAVRGELFSLKRR